MFPSLLRLPEIEVLTPETASEAAKMLFRRSNAELVAGGTDIIPKIKMKEARLGALIDLSGLRELDYIKVQKRMIKVGAMTTLSKLFANRYVRKYPAFRTLEEKFAPPIIANMATVGGSIAVRSLVSDLIVVLLTMPSNVRLLGRRGYSTTKLNRFLAKRNLRALITEVSFPTPAPNLLTLFDKVHPSNSKYPLASISLCIKTDKRGRVSYAGVAANCAKEGKPSRITRVERFMVGKKLTEDLIEDSSEKLRASVQPHADFMAPDWYRLEILEVLFRRMGMKAVKALGV